MAIHDTIYMNQQEKKSKFHHRTPSIAIMKKNEIVMIRVERL